MAATSAKETLETQVSLTGVEQVQRGHRTLGAGYKALSGSIGAVEDSYKKLSIASDRAAAAGGIIAVLRQSAKAAGEAEAAQRRLTRGIINSGAGGAKTAGDIEKYTESLSDKTAAEQASIVGAASMPAQFTMTGKGMADG